MCLDKERGGWTGPGNISISPKDGNRGERLFANAFWKSSKFVWIGGGGCPLPKPPARVRIGCWMVFSMTLILKINARKNTDTHTFIHIHKLTDSQIRDMTCTSEISFRTITKSKSKQEMVYKCAMARVPG